MKCDQFPGNLGLVFSQLIVQAIILNCSCMKNVICGRLLLRMLKTVQKYFLFVWCPLCICCVKLMLNTSRFCFDLVLWRLISALLQIWRLNLFALIFYNLCRLGNSSIWIGAQMFTIIFKTCLFPFTFFHLNLSIYSTHIFLIIIFNFFGWTGSILCWGVNLFPKLSSTCSPYMSSAN